MPQKGVNGVKDVIRIKHIGTRTGVDVLAGKDIRIDKDGVPNFEDYFTDSDEDSMEERIQQKVIEAEKAEHPAISKLKKTAIVNKSLSPFSDVSITPDCSGISDKSIKNADNTLVDADNNFTEDPLQPHIEEEENSNPEKANTVDITEVKKSSNVVKENDAFTPVDDNNLEKGANNTALQEFNIRKRLKFSIESSKAASEEFVPHYSDISDAEVDPSVSVHPIKQVDNVDQDDEIQFKNQPRTPSLSGQNLTFEKQAEKPDKSVTTGRRTSKRQQEKKAREKEEESNQTLTKTNTKSKGGNKGKNNKDKKGEKQLACGSETAEQNASCSDNSTIADVNLDTCGKKNQKEKNTSPKVSPVSKLPKVKTNKGSTKNSSVATGKNTGNSFKVRNESRNKERDPESPQVDPMFEGLSITEAVKLKQALLKSKEEAENGEKNQEKEVTNKRSRKSKDETEINKKRERESVSPKKQIENPNKSKQENDTYSESIRRKTPKKYSKVKKSGKNSRKKNQVIELDDDIPYIEVPKGVVKKASPTSQTNSPPSGPPQANTGPIVQNGNIIGFVQFAGPLLTSEGTPSEMSEADAEQENPIEFHSEPSQESTQESDDTQSSQNTSIEIKKHSSTEEENPEKDSETTNKNDLDDSISKESSSGNQVSTSHNISHINTATNDKFVKSPQPINGLSANDKAAVPSSITSHTESLEKGTAIADVAPSIVMDQSVNSSDVSQNGHLISLHRTKFYQTQEMNDTDDFEIIDDVDPEKVSKFNRPKPKKSPLKSNSKVVKKSRSISVKKTKKALVSEIKEAKSEINKKKSVSVSKEHVKNKRNRKSEKSKNSENIIISEDTADSDESGPVGNTKSVKLNKSSNENKENEGKDRQNKKNNKFKAKLQESTIVLSSADDTVSRKPRKRTTNKRYRSDEYVLANATTPSAFNKDVIKKCQEEAKLKVVDNVTTVNETEVSVNKEKKTKKNLKSKKNVNNKSNMVVTDSESDWEKEKKPRKNSGKKDKGKGKKGKLQTERNKKKSNRENELAVETVVNEESVLAVPLPESETDEELKKKGLLTPSPKQELETPKSGFVDKSKIRGRKVSFVPSSKEKKALEKSSKVKSKKAKTSDKRNKVTEDSSAGPIPDGFDLGDEADDESDYPDDDIASKGKQQNRRISSSRERRLSSVKKQPAKRSSSTSAKESSCSPEGPTPSKKRRSVVINSDIQESTPSKQLFTPTFAKGKVTPGSAPKSILKKTPKLPRYSTASPLHYGEVTLSNTPVPIEKPEEKIILPKEAPDGLRRSKRVRCKPLAWYKLEKIDYARRKSGFYIAGVNAPAYLKKVKKAGRPEKRGRRRKIPPTPRNLSVHGEIPSDAEEEITTEVPVVNPSTGEEVLLDCIQRKDGFEFIGPSCNPAEKSDPFIVCKALKQSSFSTGELLIRPLQQKCMQYVKADSMVFVIVRGKLSVTINKTVLILESGDHFLVPGGNAYEIKNLRKDEAKLIFFQHFGGEMIEYNTSASEDES